MTVPERKYAPRALPLRGGDYRIDVKRDRFGQDYSIIKQGDTITVDRPGTADDVVLQVKEDFISIRRGQDPNPETVLHQAGDRIFINRDGESKDVVVRAEGGDRIVVDRPGNREDVTYRRSRDRFEVDRHLDSEDVVISRQGDTIFVDRGQGRQVVTVKRTDRAEQLDPVVWTRETTVDPRAWDTVNKWLDQGFPQAEDLVTLTEDGRVLVWDDLLR